MKTIYSIHFKALNIKTKSNFFRYEDHGFVDDVVDYYNDYLVPKYTEKGYSFYENIDPKYKSKDGACIYGFHNPTQTYTYFSFYKPLSYPNNIYIQGHEETHALINMGKTSLLQKSFYRQGIVLSLDNYSKEFIAGLGGLNAVEKTGFKINKCGTKEGQECLKKYFSGKNNLFSPLYKLIHNNINTKVNDSIDPPVQGIIC